MTKQHVLIVDDDEDLNEFFSKSKKDARIAAGFSWHTAATRQSNADRGMAKPRRWGDEEDVAVC